ncbi:hypothetical protein TorRG33x02_354300, partial [Trema orientale]
MGRIRGGVGKTRSVPLRFNISGYCPESAPPRLLRGKPTPLAVGHRGAPPRRIKLPSLSGT